MTRQDAITLMQTVSYNELYDYTNKGNFFRIESYREKIIKGLSKVSDQEVSFCNDFKDVIDLVVVATNGQIRRLPQVFRVTCNDDSIYDISCESKGKLIRVIRDRLNDTKEINLKTYKINQTSNISDYVHK